MVAYVQHFNNVENSNSNYLTAMLPLFDRVKKITPRPYQIEAANGVKSEWAQGRKKVLVVLPGGAGKTVVAGILMEEEVLDKKRVLVVADRKKLVRQFAKATERDFGIHCSIEMGGQKSYDTSIVCATVQTISNKLKSKKFHPEEFSLIVFEEAHLCLSTSWQAVANHFSNAKFLGLTATPVASLQRDLMSFFDSKGADIPLSDLIEQGYLSPLTIINAPIRIDLQAASKTGDFTDEEVSHAIEPYLQQCAESMVKHSVDRCSLAFLPLIQTSKKFVEILRSLGVKAEHVDGDMDEREIDSIKHRLEMGEIDCVSCSLIWTVGIDIKPVSFICNLRPTRSWVLFVQTCVRGTRLFDPALDPPKGSRWGKKYDCILFDPIWNTNEHSLLQRPSCLIASSDEEADAIDRKIMQGGGDIMGDLVKAKASVIHDREVALRERLIEMSNNKKQHVDAMEFFLRMGKIDLAEYEPISKWEREKITPRQREVITKHGIDINTVSGKGHAAKILESIIERIENNQSTIKQAKAASSMGMPDAWTRSFDDVSNFIGKKKKGINPFEGGEDFPE